MKWINSAVAAVAVVAVTAMAIVLADVKTSELTSVKFGGVGGALLAKFSGQNKDGMTSTVARKGVRLARINDATGQIIDLTEQKIYNLDMKKKEYTVTTFDELRQQFAKAQADANQQQARQSAADQPAPPTAPQYTFDFDAKETGQRKTVAGYDAREVVITVTAHEQGKKIEDSGGFVLTDDEWLAPKIAALDEIADFEMQYAKALYGDMMSNIDMHQLAAMTAAFPAFQKMSDQLHAGGAKLNGTAISSTMTFDTVKSADQMAAATSQSNSNSGGGIGGLIGRKIAQKAAGPAQQRSTAMTTTLEYQSINPSASADDVAIPAGFKLKSK